MSTMAPSTRHAAWRCYRLEARNEFLRLLRTPSFVVPTLVFPPTWSARHRREGRPPGR